MATLMLLVMEGQSLPLGCIALKGFGRSSQPISTNICGCLNSNFCMASEKATKHTAFCSAAEVSKGRRPVKELEVVENWPEGAVRDTGMWK